MSRHIPDAIAKFFGYVPVEKLFAAESRANLVRQQKDTVDLRLVMAERRAAGLKAQRDLLQGFLDKANRRLEDAGMISVTTFI